MNGPAACFSPGKKMPMQFKADFHSPEKPSAPSEKGSPQPEKHSPQSEKHFHSSELSTPVCGTPKCPASRLWDVVVIGAGPAGAVSALLLAREGKKVLLVDKAVFPRSKVCGSCLSSKTLDYLNQAGLGDLPSSLNAGKNNRHQALHHRRCHSLTPATRSGALARGSGQ